jgi:hypothetical protein
MAPVATPPYCGFSLGVVTTRFSSVGGAEVSGFPLIITVSLVVGGSSLQDVRIIAITVSSVRKTHNTFFLIPFIPSSLYLFDY